MDKGLIVYPCYFDTTLKRSEGRRIPRSAGVQSPEPGDIERILKSAGIPYTREAKSHPSFGWKQQGRFVVKYESSKQELLGIIAKDLKKTEK